MTDFDDRLRRAGAAVRADVAARPVPPPPGDRRPSRLGFVAAAAAVVAVIAGAIAWYPRPIAEDTVTPPTSAQLAGRLLDGTTYVVTLEPPMTTGVGGVRGVVMIDLDVALDGCPAPCSAVVGEMSFKTGGTAGGGGGEVVAAESGGWTMEIAVYDHVAAEVDDIEAVLADGIVPVEGGDLPAFELRAPLRWADDGEVPSAMEVSHGAFVVRRGCAGDAVACSRGGEVQVIPTERVMTPAPEWDPDRAVAIEVTAEPTRPAGVFRPDIEVQDGMAVTTVEFLDGSSAEVAWPEALDLTSEGVTIGGWVGSPDASRDLWVHYGPVEEMMAELDAQFLAEYPDSAGGTVGFWRPARDVVDYLAYQFGPWGVLVYDYRPGGAGPSLGDDGRALWARSIDGRETADGYLRITVDDPLWLGPAGQYPSPIVVGFSGSDGSVDLVPGPCDPGSIGDGVWCDESGLMTVLPYGSDEFVAAVRGGFEVRDVDLALGSVRAGEGQVFSEPSGVVLLVDDGIDGVTAVDLDRSIAARSVVEGQRAGDEPYSMEKVGDDLVVGWSEVVAVDIITREARRLGLATIFVPAAEDGRVWLIEWDAGFIGGGDAVAWQVSTDGEVTVEPTALPAGPKAFPQMGIPGGLALQTDTGLRLWDAASGATTDLNGDGRGIALDAHGPALLWCDTGTAPMPTAGCGSLHVTDTETLETETFLPPDGGRYAGFGPDAAAFSPDGTLIAALLTGNQGGVWITERRFGSPPRVSGAPGPAPQHLAWSPDGTQVYATQNSYGADTTSVWRWDLTSDVFETTALPFGDAMSLVVVDADDAGAYFGADVRSAPKDCPAPRELPEGREGLCTFAFTARPAG